MTFDCFNLQGGKILEKIRDLPQTHLLFENALQLPWQVANPNSKKKKKKSENVGILNAIFSACLNKNGSGGGGARGGTRKWKKKAAFASYSIVLGLPSPHKEERGQGTS